MKIKIISVIGYSGTGKTHFILNATKLLKKVLNKEVSVIKFIHEHQIDKEGKDSYKYSEVGVSYSVLKNIENETTIFLKKDIDIKSIIDWLSKGPYKTDFIFTEGFRELNYPTVLCITNFDEVESQLTRNVKMISGAICLTMDNQKDYLNLPIINIEKEFKRFLKIFSIK
ncbi:MAG: molybdopterin-guanine dinucleotide biosynthesis protein B [Candidatus Hodarchaeota archaeon]